MAVIISVDHLQPAFAGRERTEILDLDQCDDEISRLSLASGAQLVYILG